MQASLICASGEPREVHHFAALIGYGANAVYPYLVYETIDEHGCRGSALGGLYGWHNCASTLPRPSSKGLLKIMSKMGISTIDSYCGAQIFEALGIGPELLDVAFRGTPSLVGGIGFASVAEDVLAWHAYGYPEDSDGAEVKLETWGLYKSRRGGELHTWSPEVVHALHRRRPRRERR